MPINRFESSRVAAGTLNAGAQNLAETSHTAPAESNAISRDDVRDGFSEDSGDGKFERRVVGATDLVGDRVRNPAGESLGKIQQLMIDITTGKVAYAVLSFGGFLKIGDKLFAIPWSALRFDQSEQEFILDVDRATLENAPGFDKDNWPNMADPGFAAAIHGHYGQPPYWRHDTTDTGDYIGDNSQPNRSMEHEPVTSYHSENH